MRKFACGDIHGNREALIECLSLVSFDYDNDMLISLGDLCDRGPDSYGVVEELMKIKNLVHVRGNHDQWFMDAMNGKYVDDGWKIHGGKTTLASYAFRSDEDYAAHMEFYDKSVFYHVEDNMVFVHAGWEKERPIYQTHESTLMWDRLFVQQMMSCKGKQRLKIADPFEHSFIGHTPTIYWNMECKPITRGGVTNLDTGCGKGGKLTIMDINTKEYWTTAGHF